MQTTQLEMGREWRMMTGENGHIDIYMHGNINRKEQNRTGD